MPRPVLCDGCKVPCTEFHVLMECNTLRVFYDADRDVKTVDQAREHCTKVLAEHKVRVHIIASSPCQSAIRVTIAGVPHLQVAFDFDLARGHFWQLRLPSEADKWRACTQVLNHFRSAVGKATWYQKPTMPSAMDNCVTM